MKKNFLKSMLSETGSNEYSHKRVIGVIGSFFIILDMMLCSFKYAIAPPDSLVSACEIIVVGCVFGTAAERFANYRKNIIPNQNLYQPQEPVYQNYGNETAIDTSNNNQPQNLDNNEN